MGTICRHFDAPLLKIIHTTLFRQISTYEPVECWATDSQSTICTLRPLFMSFFFNLNPMLHFLQKVTARDLYYILHLTCCCAISLQTDLPVLVSLMSYYEWWSNPILCVSFYCKTRTASWCKGGGVSLLLPSFNKFCFNLSKTKFNIRLQLTIYKSQTLGYENI